MQTDSIEFKACRKVVDAMLQLLIDSGQEWVEEEGKSDEDMTLTARSLSVATMFAADVLASAIEGRDGLKEGHRIMADGIMMLAQARIDDEEAEEKSKH